MFNGKTVAVTLTAFAALIVALPFMLWRRREKAQRVFEGGYPRMDDEFKYDTGDLLE